jgi:hypothetical protein
MDTNGSAGSAITMVNVTTTNNQMCEVSMNDGRGFASRYALDIDKVRYFHDGIHVVVSYYVVESSVSLHSFVRNATSGAEFRCPLVLVL